MTEGTERRPVYSDAPIERVDDDQLQRSVFAKAVARQLVSAPANEGFAVSLTGPWGSGKTSVMRMVAEHVSELQLDAIVVEFNPWLYSRAEELVSRFLIELSRALFRAERWYKKIRPGRGVKKAASKLRDYARAVAPVGGVVGTVAAVSGGVASDIAGDTSAIAQRDAVIEALKNLDVRVVVLIDDIDRVADDQVRELVRLVKLVGDLPNTSYLLAYDSGAIANAVGHGTESLGRAYMEKIIQVEHALPLMPDWLLHPALIKAINEVAASFADNALGPFDPRRWQNVYAIGIRPLFRSLRDVRRYANTVAVPLEVIGDEVAVADVLAMEALRLFTPRSFAKFVELRDRVLNPPTADVMAAMQEGDVLDEIAAQAEDREQSVKRLLEYMFRSDTHDARKRRLVAHPAVLRIYLEHARPGTVTPASALTTALSLIGDPDTFVAFVEGFSPEEREDLLQRLEDHADEFDTGQAADFLVGIFNVLPGLREGSRGLFGFTPETLVVRLALRMLERIDDPQDRLAVVEEALPRIHQLSSRLELVDAVGHRPNVGHKLVEEAPAMLVYAGILDEGLSSDSSVLAQERLLWDLFYRAYELTGDEAQERIRELVEDDDTFIRLLRSRLSEATSQVLGEAAIAREPRLPWESLVEMLGQDFLLSRLANVDRSRTRDERDSLALETADRYVRGEIKNDRYISNEDGEFHPAGDD